MSDNVPGRIDRPAHDPLDIEASPLQVQVEAYRKDMNAACHYAGIMQTVDDDAWAEGGRAEYRMMHEALAKIVGFINCAGSHVMKIEELCNGNPEPGGNGTVAS